MTTSHYCLQLRPISLADGETLVLEDARGVVIDATSGLLWVTVSGEPGDVFLAPGQSYCVMGRGRVVIEGTTKSLNELRLHPPARVTNAWFGMLKLGRLMARHMRISDDYGSGQLRGICRFMLRPATTCDAARTRRQADQG